MSFHMELAPLKATDTGLEIKTEISNSPDLSRNVIFLEWDLLSNKLPRCRKIIFSEGIQTQWP